MRTVVREVLPYRQRRLPALFIALEILALAAVPVLASIGLTTLLRSTAGNFVEEIGRNDPGWRSPVEPSPVTLIMTITDDGSIGSLALATTPTATAPGGGLIILPTSLVVDGTPLVAYQRDQIPDVVANSLRLGVDQTLTLDSAGWRAALGGVQLAIDNPDPVRNDAGVELVGVGASDVAGDLAPAFLSYAAPEADPLAVTVRQQLFWDELFRHGSLGSGQAAELFEQIAAGTHRVAVVPSIEVDGLYVVDPEPAEELIRQVTPYPAGPGRLQVRVLTRSLDNDVVAVAQHVAAMGVEVLEVGNAASFDDGSTSLLIPNGFGADTSSRWFGEYEELLAYANGAQAQALAGDDFDTVTLVIGAGERTEP